jgi:hypothetical protein
MDVNEYTLECMVRLKLHEAREVSRRRALLATSRPPGWQKRLGTALIGLGVWLSARAAATVPTTSNDALLGHRSHG